MHNINLAALAGIGFLAIGAIFLLPDPILFRASYGMMVGPIFWIVGCALMVAWAIWRVSLAVTRNSDISDEPPSARKEGTPLHKQPTESEADAAASHRSVAAGRVVADFLAPLAIWLLLLSMIATIVLLLGYRLA
jgi:hypothetical protein